MPADPFGPGAGPMSHRAALRYLDGLINREATPKVAAGDVADLSLDAMRALMAALGDPQHAYPVLHITGTNGKGSVATMAARLLEALGLSVGVYASPHLQVLNERLRWTGGLIDDDELGRIIGEVAAVADVAGVTPSYFEVLTASAFAWFAELPVDVAVVEVGVLGRFDATNVADAAVAVITNIGPDHTDFRPGWREAIAEEKVGIVKDASFLVLGETDDELRPIFEDAAGDRLWVLDEDVAVTEVRDALGGRVVDVRTPFDELDDLFVPVHGDHQATNAALAIAAVEALTGRGLDAELAREAFAEVRLPGRFEIVGRGPLLVLDGAHNADGAAALAATLGGEFEVGGRRLLVLGMLAGRDPLAYLEALEVGAFDLVLCCTAPSERAVPAAELVQACASLGVDAEAVGDVADALDRARATSTEEDVVVVTGSIYVVGAARDALGLRPPDRP